MDTARALPRGLADLELCRLRPACVRADLVAGPLAVERLYLVALMGAIVYAAFFIALIAMPIYGGAAYDKNGYQPFKAPIPIIAKKWDANITAFSFSW